MNTQDRFIGDGKRPAIFSRDSADYWQVLATAAILRLFPMRKDSIVRQCIRGWIQTLREVQKVRAFRNW